jgi:hypothetical protein
MESIKKNKIKRKEKEKKKKKLIKLYYNELNII